MSCKVTFCFAICHKEESERQKRKTCHRESL